MSIEQPNLAIRLNNLEEDCAEQSELRKAWGLEYAKAKREVSAGKENVKLIKAQLGKEFRSDVRINMGLKVTEASTEEYIVMSDTYQNAMADLIQREFEADVLKEFIASLENRKDMLSDEVKLHGQGYWSKPWTKNDPQQSQAERIRDASATVQGNMGIEFVEKKPTPASDFNPKPTKHPSKSPKK